MYIWVFSIVHQPSLEQQRYEPQQTNGYMQQGEPRVDQHGSHEFIEWQTEQQQLHKEMKFRNPPKVDRNGSREFIEWQTHQQQLYKQMKLRCPPKIDRNGSLEFVEWQQKQQQLYKEMNGIAEKVSNNAFYIVQILRDITGQTMRTRSMV